MLRASLIAVALVLLVACVDTTATDSEFCKQAQFFASRSIRDTDPSEDRSEAGYLVALTNLRDLAPANLHADLDLLVAYEQDFDPNTKGETDDAAVALAGVRVGAAIELSCRLELPSVGDDGG